MTPTPSGDAVPAASDGFPADTLARLAAKPYMAPAPRHGADAINVLTLGFGEHVARFFTACAQVSDTRGPNVRRLFYRCGDVNVEDLSEIDDGARTNSFGKAVSPDAHAALVEEVGVVARGERARFGAEMRASGWFSGGVLRRHYARETPEFSARPHAVLAYHDGAYYSRDAAQMLPLVEGALDPTEARVFIVREPAEARRAAETVADMLEGRHLLARVGEAFDEGVRAGGADAKAELKRRPVVRETVVVHMPPVLQAAVADGGGATLRRATECEATLREVLRKLDAAQEDKKAAVSKAFESGVRNARDVSA